MKIAVLVELENLCTRLTQARKKARKTRKQVAKRLNMSEPNLSNIENGGCQKVSIDFLKAIDEIYSTNFTEEAEQKLLDDITKRN